MKHVDPCGNAAAGPIDRARLADDQMIENSRKTLQLVVQGVSFGTAGVRRDRIRRRSRQTPWGQRETKRTVKACATVGHRCESANRLPRAGARECWMIGVWPRVSCKKNRIQVPAGSVAANASTDAPAAALPYPAVAGYRVGRASSTVTT